MCLFVVIYTGCWCNAQYFPLFILDRVSLSSFKQMYTFISNYRYSHTYQGQKKSKYLSKSQGTVRNAPNKWQYACTHLNVYYSSQSNIKPLHCSWFVGSHK